MKVITVKMIAYSLREHLRCLKLKNSVSVSQKTHWVHITKINLSILWRENVPVYTGKHN
jgi:hypothetical protein